MYISLLTRFCYAASLIIIRSCVWGAHNCDIVMTIKNERYTTAPCLRVDTKLLMCVENVSVNSREKSTYYSCQTINVRDYNIMLFQGCNSGHCIIVLQYHTTYNNILLVCAPVLFFC